MRTSLSFVRLNPLPLCALAIALCVAVAHAATSQTSPKIWEEFSGEKALAHVQRLVDFGPHPPGSEAIEKCRVYIDNQLKSFGWQVTKQTFSDETPLGKIRFVNLIARFCSAGSETASAPL